MRLGVFLAFVSAASFALSGPLARGLFDAGWSPGAVVFARIFIAALFIAPFAVRRLRGKWGLLRQNARIILMLGAVSVAGTQFAFFSAIAAMDIGPALLIEFTAPVAVVAWLWLRWGEPPRARTIVGGSLAIIGLAIVLDLFSGTDLAWEGVVWAFAAMFGLASFFVTSANRRTGLPPLVFACSGLATGSLVLGVLGLIGIMPVSMTNASPVYAGESFPWWTALIMLSVIATAVPYVTGIVAIRKLGSRLASFVGLLEVVIAILFAWLLIDQVPGLSQILGGLLIVTGVIIVRLGEPL